VVRIDIMKLASELTSHKLKLKSHFIEGREWNVESGHAYLNYTFSLELDNNLTSSYIIVRILYSYDPGPTPQANEAQEYQDNRLSDKVNTFNAEINILAYKLEFYGGFYSPIYASAP